jgi:hypothetical protein
MPKIKKSGKVVWSSDTIEKTMPLGVKCRGNCRKIHEDITKNCPNCKTYKREYLLEYGRKNKEKISKRNAEKYIANMEKIKERSTKRYQERKEEILEQIKEYREKNYDEIRERDCARANTREGKYLKIIQNAKGRGRIVEMTKDEIMNMTDLPCVYCNKETIDGVKRNGIDRMDNSIGYILENCVPCCEICNYMKQSLDPNTFVERCSQISSVHGGIGVDTEYWVDTNFMSFAKYKRRTIKDGTSFELTKEEYEYLRQQSCMYCRRPTTKMHHNGIDRLDSSIGYIRSNCVTCCGGCNIAKGKKTPEEFIDQCKIIADREHHFPDIPRYIYIWGRV